MELPGTSPDLVRRLVEPVQQRVGAWLAAHEVAAPLRTPLLDAFGIAVVIGIVLVVLALRHVAGRRPLALAFVLPAGVLLVWLLRHPATSMELLLGRLDHVLFAACGGAVVRVLPARARTVALAAVSLGALLWTIGPVPVGLVAGGVAAGVLAQRATAGRAPRVIALGQGVVAVATLAACWAVWRHNYFLGIGAPGLYAFVLMRHVSWVVDRERGAGGTLLDYAAYQLFYPPCFGAMERYHDFRDHNPALGAAMDDRQALALLVRGSLYVWVVARIPIDLNALLLLPAGPVFWGGYLLVFIRSSLYLMGIWAVIEALALLWGVRLRPNFAGILAATNPSRFWYAWRGTMTHWLVEYVYIPLGGNRAHQVRNVFAVFAVSGAWHCLGVPFLYRDWGVGDLASIWLWAAFNAMVLSAVVVGRRRRWQLLPAATPAPLRTETHRLGTWLFGGVTATVLAFQGPLRDHLGPFLAKMLGFG